MFYSELAQPKLQLVVENSYTTTLSGTLEEYGNVIMYFRQVNAYVENSEVRFKNFVSRTNIQLINFINIGSVIVENTVIQNIDDLDFKNTRDCYFIEADYSKQPVTCNKEDLFYKIKSL